MEKEDLKRQVEMLRIHKDLQRMCVSDAVKEYVFYKLQVCPDMAMFVSTLSLIVYVICKCKFLHTKNYYISYILTLFADIHFATVATIILASVTHKNH